MKYTIDLHNLIEHEAISKIEMAILTFNDTDEYDELEIITGNGEVLKDVTIDILSDNNLDYEFLNNGCILVKKYD